MKRTTVVTIAAAKPTTAAATLMVTQTTNSSALASALQIDFTLATASQIKFDVLLGSVEFPNWVNQYADSRLVFLDGTTNQIIFDSLGNPIDVGSSVATMPSTLDTNTTFGDPHGVLGLITTSALLSAGAPFAWHLVRFVDTDAQSP